MFDLKVLSLCDWIVEIPIVLILLLLGEMLGIELIMMLLGQHEVGLVWLVHICSMAIRE